MSDELMTLIRQYGDARENVVGAAEHASPAEADEHQAQADKLLEQIERLHHGVTVDTSRLTHDISRDLREWAAHESEADRHKLLIEAADKLDTLISLLARAEQARDDNRDRLNRAHVAAGQNAAQVQLQLERINTALQHAGIEHSRGLAGVDDLAAMAIRRLEELNTMRITLDLTEAERRNYLDECHRLRLMRPVFDTAKTWAACYDGGHFGMAGSSKRAAYTKASADLAAAVDAHAQQQAAQDAKQTKTTTLTGDIVLCRVAVVDVADTARRQHASADRPPLAYSRALREHDFRFHLTENGSEITFGADARAADIAESLNHAPVAVIPPGPVADAVADFLSDPSTSTRRTRPQRPGHGA